MTNWERLGLPSAKQLSNRIDLPWFPPLLARATDIDAAHFQLRAAVGVVPGGTRRVTTPVGDRTIDDTWLAHVVEKREAARERYAHLIVSTLVDPVEVWLSDYDGERRERFLKLWRNDNKIMLVVISIEKGYVLWNVVPMPIRSVDRQRAGVLLWKKYQ